MKIGFLDRSDASWTAGASYSRSMVNALASAADERGEIIVVSGACGSLTTLPAGARAVRSELERLNPVEIKCIVAAEGIDVLLPITEALLPDTACALVGWIPDFQHRRLPQYFTEDQRRQRDRHFGYLIDNCDAMMFSSEAVRADFNDLYPAFSGSTVAVHFPSSFAYEAALVADDPRPVIEKYHLPPAFVVVANQFWKHKNHRLVVEAVARARQARPEVHVVMVGMLSDSRDVANPHLSEMIRRLSTERLFENISVLGEVPFGDLVALLRCAVEVVQPSEFEGWNTTLQDAMALGKRVACSDLATHREQTPDAFFFAPDDAAALATHFEGLDWSRPGWEGVDRERESLVAERERGRRWAGGLIDFCAQLAKQRRAAAPSRTSWRDPVEELKANPLTYIEYLEAQNQSLHGRATTMETNATKAQERLEETRRKAAEDRQILEERVKTARLETREALDRYARERAIPLRQRLRDELRRLMGRKTA